MNDRDFMLEALSQAKIAMECGEMPVGCVIVRNGEIIARSHNECEALHDATAHAEMLCIRRASEITGDWRLNDCTLYVTLEPCPMCAGAIIQARLGRLVFGAYDETCGCAGSVYRIPEDPAFNHFCKSEGGILKEECRAALDAFFAAKRA